MPSPTRAHSAPPTLVGRQEAQHRAGGRDPFADRWVLVAGDVVHDYEITELEFRHEHLLHIGP